LKIYFVRHGEPDYGVIDERGYMGHGRDLAPLTEKGRAQAEIAACDPRLKEASLIVSSPYTRALQTAAAISRQTGLDIRVEVALHEWMPDLSFRYDCSEYSIGASLEYEAKNGIRDESCRYNWESKEQLFARAHSWLDRYRDHDYIIAVSHGMVIRQFAGEIPLSCCSITEIEI